MIELSREGAIHRITLNNGPNMIDLDWLDRMHAVLDTVEADCEGEAGLVLTGTGKFFCSGLNVEKLMALTEEEIPRFSSGMLGFMRRLISLPVPTVAAINGHAFAGGAFVTLGCDYRVMRADKGWVCISEVDVGVPIGDPMMRLLKAKLTPQIARNAALTGKRYTAEEALDAGMVDSISTEEALLAEATALATSMAGKERGIFSTIKRQLNADLIKGFTVET